MNEIVKKHRGKIVSGGSLTVLAVIILFFWDLGVSREDLRRVPHTNQNVATLMEERPEIAKQLNRVTKSMDSMIVVLSQTNKLLQEVRKELKKTR